MSDTAPALGYRGSLPLRLSLALLLATELVALATVLPRTCTVSDPAPVFASTEITDPRFIAPEPYRAAVMHWAAVYGIPLDIAIRLPFEESRWNPVATGANRNGTYDHGLYQLNSRYHAVNLPEVNIRDGLAYLATCYRATGTWRRAVVAYQTGIAGMKGGTNKKGPPRSALREAAAVVGGGM